MSEEKGRAGVSVQPLKVCVCVWVVVGVRMGVRCGEMPLQQSPCDDFTITVTPLDPQHPLLDRAEKPPSLQTPPPQLPPPPPPLVPIGLPRATAASEGTRGWIGE